ncbi:MAG TPA: hypothetical protein VHW24_25730 [Bryobacteraceae bacterium]|nr:hypothetical protein [Bryobacteraceae bacterium]
MRGNNEEKLDALFRAFAACPTPDPSANFMPALWQKIEARQSFTFSFRRMANAFAAAAVALTVALSVYMYVPHTPAMPSQTYMDVLADAHPLVAPELLSPARLEFETGK